MSINLSIASETIPVLRCCGGLNAAGGGCGFAYYNGRAPRCILERDGVGTCQAYQLLTEYELIREGLEHDTVCAVVDYTCSSCKTS
jgi:hypothetical protein